MVVHDFNIAGTTLGPSEADSIILQVTVGCSYNKCTFCGAYKDVDFCIKEDHKIDADLNFASIYCRKQKRVFLADGDVLILSQKRLVKLLKKIRINLPWVSRVSLYGSAKAIRSKSIPELLELKSLGLDRIYMGLESGNNQVLQDVRKGETAKSMILAAQTIKQSGLFLSVTALLGLGGSQFSELHAIETAKTLNAMEPRQIGVLTFMPLENTQMGKNVANGSFKLLTPYEILQELYVLLSHLHLNRCLFHANHASNYVPISGRLTKDKQYLLSSIEMALKGAVPIVPEHRRAL